VQQHREHNDAAAHKKPDVEVFVFAKDGEGEQDAVNGFEVDGQVEREGGKVLERIERKYEGDVGAEHGKDEQQQPVGCVGQQFFGLQQVDVERQKHCEHRQPRHNFVKRHHAAGYLGYYFLIENIKERPHECRQQREDDAGAEIVFIGIENNADARHCHDAENQFGFVKLFVGNQRLYQRGEQGSGRQQTERDADVGIFNASVKKQPVYHEQRADENELNELWLGNPEFAVRPFYIHKQRNGNNCHSVPHQHAFA